MDEDHAEQGRDEDAPERGPGAAGVLAADRVEFALGAVGMARGREIQISQSAVGLAAGDEIEFRQSGVRVAMAREAVRLHMSAAAAVVGYRVDVAPRTAVAVLIAQHVDGDVRPLLDWRGAAVCGAAFALVAGLIGPRRRRRR
jgi:hypothetical protein